MKLFIAMCFFSFLLNVGIIDEPTTEYKEPIKIETKTEECITGVASWYDYDLPEAKDWSLTHDTAASRTLTRYSYVKVKHNDKEVIVFINDFGPEPCPEDNPNDIVRCPMREIDLSSHAFKQLAPLKLGLINVEVCVIKD